MHGFKKLKKGVLASFILIALTLSFAQVTSYDPVILRSSFTIADQLDLPTRGNVGMAYDNESDLVVIFGGWNQTDDPWNSTWTYDYEADLYTEMEPATSPVGRAEPGMTYDSTRDQMILFGGMTVVGTEETPVNDTFTYDFNTNTWTEVFPTIAPSNRRAHEIAYDSESDRVILFGGGFEFGGGSINDTWSYNPGTNVWTEMSPSIAPSARFTHKLAYDIESDRVILFGGFNGGSWTNPSDYYGDTWAYDFNSDTWELLTTTGSPSVRGVPSLTYDSESDSVVLFGGSMGSTSYDDTWVFIYNTLTWEEMSPTTSPSPRSRHGSAYDWESDQVIIYGGTKSGFNSQYQISGDLDEGKTWAYDVNANTWERKDQGNPPPEPPTTTTTTDPPTTPTGGDMTLIYIAVAGIGVVLILVIFFVRRR